MVNFYDDDDREGEAPLIRTQAELTLQNLLQKQLSTTGRLEQVEFEEVTQSMHCIGHGYSGVGTLAQFRENELLQKKESDYTQASSNLAQLQGVVKDANKRKRYGPNPSFIQHALDEEQERQRQHHLNQNQIQEAAGRQRNWSRHSEELEASLLRGKDKLKAISHLSSGESASRKPLLNNTELSEIYRDTTPQERARSNKAVQECTRSASEVFSSPAPDILDLNTYLEEKHQEQRNGHTELKKTASTTINIERNSTESKEQSQSSYCSSSIENILETEILANKLSEDEIRAMPGGKFANYTPGVPSHILYIKNLSTDVKETDLAALFIRFQSPGKRLLFRLMQHGRMKGQAFVTFPDTDTASLALQVTNGFRFKGKPIVIQYGRGPGRDN
eukprot:Gb_26417 [translate_table: standard]